LPQDHTLLVVLKERDGRIWREKLDFLVANHGMALLVTHPDYLQSPVELDIYRRFLADAAERDVCWHALPRDVARWWRDRQASQLVADAAGNVSIEGPAAERGTTCTIGALCDAQPPANLCVPGKGERDFLPA
jgi:hypothetical protein